MTTRVLPLRFKLLKGVLLSIFNRIMFTDQTRQDVAKAWGSSVTAVTVCSPLEVLKINAQVTPHNSSIRTMFKDIYRTHSFRGFYKGYGVSLLAQPGYWSIYLPIYNSLKSKIQNEDGTLDLHKKFAAVFCSSTIASVSVNPLFVFKTRFQTSVFKKGTDGTLKHPKVSYIQMAKDIAKEEGLRGFYKGNLVAQVKNTQMLLQMPLHDFLNNHPLNPLESSSFFLFDRAFVSGTIAKTVASCMVFYPVDVIRTNLRDQVENKSVMQIVHEIYRRPGGILNFYRGVGIYWLSAVPTFGLTMYVYENLSFGKITEKLK